MARSREQADQSKGQLSAGAGIDRDEQAFDVGHEPPRLECLLVQAHRLLGGERKRPSAQRSIGGIDMVVTTAIATIVVNRFWFSTPIDNPIEATITSVEPRAFIPQPRASASAQFIPASRPPRNAPPNLPMLAMAIRPTVSSRRLGLANTSRSVPTPPCRKTPA